MIAKLKHHIQPIIALGIRGGSILAGFFVTFYIGRTLGPEANGIYGLVTQTGVFLSVISVGGLDIAAVRELSRSIAEKRGIERSTYFKIVGWTVAIALAIAAILLLGGHRVTHWLMKSEQSFAITVLLSLIFLGRALTRIMSAFLRSQKSFIFGQSVEVLIIPGVVSIALLLGFMTSVREILAFTAFVGLVTGIGAVIVGLRYTVTDGTGLQLSFRSLFKIALPLWSVAIALNIADWYSLFTVASVLGVYDAGLYRVAYQVASVLSIITLALYSVFTVRISAARAAGDIHEVARLGRTSTRLSIAFATPLLIVIFVFAPQILGLIGEDFVGGVAALRIMAITQAIYVATGPNGLTLAMCGLERINLVITVSSLAFLLVVAPMAARWGGLVGISAFVGIAMASRNIAAFFALRHFTGINVITGSVETPKRAFAL